MNVSARPVLIFFYARSSFSAFLTIVPKYFLPKPDVESIEFGQNYVKIILLIVRSSIFLQFYDV